MSENETIEMKKTAKPLSMIEKFFCWLFTVLFLALAYVGIKDVFQSKYTDIEKLIIYSIIFFAVISALLLMYRVSIPIGNQKFLGDLPIYSIVGLIITILIAVAYPQTNQYCCGRGYDSDAKSNLHNLYLGCKAYWADQGPEQVCDVSKVATQEYGYIQSTRVSVYGNGTEATFTATAQHMDSTKRYTMDANGNIK